MNCSCRSNSSDSKDFSKISEGSYRGDYFDLNLYLYLKMCFPLDSGLTCLVLFVLSMI